MPLINSYSPEEACIMAVNRAVNKTKNKALNISVCAINKKGQHGGNDCHLTSICLFSKLN